MFFNRGLDVLLGLKEPHQSGLSDTFQFVHVNGEPEFTTMYLDQSFYFIYTSIRYHY